jgi:glutaredoxin
MDVLLLIQDQCHFCNMAKEILDRLSREYQFTLSTLNLNTDEGQALAEQNGILFAPGLFINGAPISYGRPSEKRLRREFERLGHNSTACR